MRKNRAGRGIHRSDFICKIVSWVKEGGQWLEYGSNYEDYWTGEMLAQQLKEKVIDAFEAAHPPGTLGIFIFDKSSEHSIYANDALVASRMNIGPDGRHVPNMRDGLCFVDGVKMSQQIVNIRGPRKA